jgi:hypothetical protein
VNRHAMIVSTALIIALPGCGDGSTGSSELQLPPTTVGASAPGSIPAEAGMIEPGTYRIPKSDWSVVDFTVTFPEGWTAQYGHVYHKHQDTSEEFGFYAVVVDQIFTDACGGDGVPSEVGSGADDLVAALLQQPGPTTSGPFKTTLGRYGVTRIDLHIPQELDLETCRLFDDGIRGLQIWYSAPADKYFVLLPDAVASVYVLDVDGQRQVFLAQYPSTISDADRSELETVLESVIISA